eukprot:4866982-Amphidinium_carterae.2
MRRVGQAPEPSGLTFASTHDVGKISSLQLLAFSVLLGRDFQTLGGQLSNRLYEFGWFEEIVSERRHAPIEKVLEEMPVEDELENGHQSIATGGILDCFKSLEETPR